MLLRPPSHGRALTSPWSLQFKFVSMQKSRLQSRTKPRVRTGMRGSKPTFAEPIPCSITAISSLDGCDQCCVSVLFHSLVPATLHSSASVYALPELTHDPKVIRGYYIPPKTSMLIDAYTLNRSAPIWGDDGNSFRPDRFASITPTQYRYSYWRFGIGPR
jgi:Cytochrome P450